MNESHLRMYVRSILIEAKNEQNLAVMSDLDDLKDTCDSLPDDFIQRTLDPIMGEYASNPTIRKEADAIYKLLDDVAFKASAGMVGLGVLLTITGVGSEVGIPMTIAGASEVLTLSGAAIVGGSLVGIGNSTMQATAALARGDNNQAGVNIALAILDGVLAGIGGQITSLASRGVASAASIGAHSGAAAASDAAGTMAAKFMSSTAASGAAQVVLQIIGNELVSFAKTYDERRSNEGLPANPALTKPTRDLAKRLTSGMPEIDDINIIVAKAVGLGIIKKEDEQVVFDQLFYSVEGQSPN